MGIKLSHWTRTWAKGRDPKSYAAMPSECLCITWESDWLILWCLYQFCGQRPANYSFHICSGQDTESKLHCSTQLIKLGPFSADNPDNLPSRNKLYQLYRLLFSRAFQTQWLCTNECVFIYFSRWVFSCKVVFLHSVKWSEALISP